MAGGTVGTHLDEGTLAALKALASIENRPTSQIVGVALKMALDLSPGARRALFAIDGMASEDERAFAMKAIGRSALKAYERILDARRPAENPPSINVALDTDEAIEAEAVRLCRS